MKLKFTQDFKKEIWFIENKFSEARKQIGEQRFAYIINYNVPNGYHKNNKVFYKNLRNYLKNNKKIITSEIKNKKMFLERKWRKYEKVFFKQIQEITGLNWKYQNYNVYLLNSCFWGGDYDVDKSNIYINPLLKYGDPLYVIFHELSHLLFWEYIYSKYSKSFIKKNSEYLWNLSEVMVNYPLLKLKINYKFPIIIPPNLKKFSTHIIKKFPTFEFVAIIDSDIKRNRTINGLSG